MRAPWALLFALGACGFELNAGVAGSDAGGDDAMDASGTTGGDSGFGCYGTGLVRVCPLTAPVPAFEITEPRRLDTSLGSNCTAVTGTNVTGLCAVVAEDIVVGAELRGVGTMPLLLVATRSLTITAAVDVASRDGDVGAGAPTTVCTSGNGPNTQIDGEGGGAGGSFTGAGGGGGNLGGGAPGPTDAVPGSVHGGCRGQRGGGSGGEGGMGGGVLYAIAKDEITLAASGRINASGRGGRGAGSQFASGGGGGGAGGMIVLDAAALKLEGPIFANGGGGGGGSDLFASGSEGASAADAVTVPTGGGGGGAAGRGGDGGGMTVTSGARGQGTTFGIAGGGGGGGGTGYVLLLGERTGTGVISPPP